MFAPLHGDSGGSRPLATTVQSTPSASGPPNLCPMRLGCFSTGIRAARHMCSALAAGQGSALPLPWSPCAHSQEPLSGHREGCWKSPRFPAQDPMASMAFLQCWGGEQEELGRVEQVGRTTETGRFIFYNAEKYSRLSLEQGRKDTFRLEQLRAQTHGQCVQGLVGPEQVRHRTGQGSSGPGGPRS